MRMNIEAERSRRGLTKSQMSKAIGVSVNTYSSYLKGAAIPSDKLMIMADMFGVSCDYLLGRNCGHQMENEKR